MPIQLIPLTQEELEAELAPRVRGGISGDVLTEYLAHLNSIEVGKGVKVMTFEKPVTVKIKGVATQQNEPYLTVEPELSLRSFKRRLNSAAKIKSLALNWTEKVGQTNITVAAKKIEKKTDEKPAEAPAEVAQVGMTGDIPKPAAPVADKPAAPVVQPAAPAVQTPVAQRPAPRLPVASGKPS